MRHAIKSEVYVHVAMVLLLVSMHCDTTQARARCIAEVQYLFFGEVIQLLSQGLGATVQQQ